MAKYNVDEIRMQFPALSRTVNGWPAVYLDGPGGTQVPRRVAEKITEYLYYYNANSHGSFRSSHESDALYATSKEKLAAFLGCSADEIAYGGSTSTNNFLLTYGILRDLKPGDEVLITDIDHEGNRSPLRTLADFGIVVKSAAIHSDTISLDYEDFASKLTPKTKVVAVNWATNSCGTITDVKKCIALARQKASPDVITIVDAVHAAPHKFIDVKDIDTDVLLCSAYKFFGPHLGVWYMKKETGERLKSVRVMSYDNTDMPWKLETGTPAMELANGAGEAVEFIADIGRKYGDEYRALAPVELSGLREDIWLGMKAIEVHEDSLSAKLRSELPKIPGLKIYGATDPNARTSTVSFAVDGIHAGDIATYLGEKGIFVWDGDFYAMETINNVLGMFDVGGLVRIGMAAYNTEQEIDYTIAAIKEYIESRR